LAPPAPKPKETKAQLEVEGGQQQPPPTPPKLPEKTTTVVEENKKMQEEADSIIVVSAEVYTAPATPLKENRSENDKEGRQVAAKQATPAKKRPPPSLPPSSSSERERSLSPQINKRAESTQPFTVVPARGRNRKRKQAKQTATAAAEGSPESMEEEGGLFKVPLAEAVPRPSTLEDLVLTPEMETEATDDGGGGGG